MEEGIHIPIIKLYDTFIVSIQVDLSDQLILQLKEDIMRAIHRIGASGLVIDVSGIDLMDSFIARAIRDIGLIAQIMGVETAVCGIDPMIALTLVEMGMELKGVTTTRDLDSALGRLDAMAKSEEGQDDRVLALATELSKGDELLALSLARPGDKP